MNELVNYYAADSAGFELSWAQVILIAIGVAGVVVTLFKADDGREKRRREAIRASASFERIGLGRFSAFCEAYAVGDFTGMTAEAGHLAEKIREAGEADKLAAEVVVTTLPSLLSHPIHGPAIRDAIAKASGPAEAPASPGVVTGAGHGIGLR